jgi:prephenate dehydratase
MTRFVILKKENSFVSEDEINRASIKFELDHKRGSLAAVLNVMSDCKLNLTKIQSLPKIETPWKYSFFVDVTFDKYEMKLGNVLRRPIDGLIAYHVANS